MNTGSASSIGTRSTTLTPCSVLQQQTANANIGPMGYLTSLGIKATQLESTLQQPARVDEAA